MARWTILAVLLLVLHPAAWSQGVPSADDIDPIRDSLAMAKRVYSETLTQARASLISAIDTAIQEKAKSGDLDAVLSLRAEKDAFDDSGRLPSGAGLRVFATEHEKAVKVARTKLEAAYENAVKEYTKALKIKQAEAVQAELHALRGTVEPVTPAKKFSLEYTFYNWRKGNQPVKMLHKDEGFCYLIGIGGAFNGGGELAQITLEKDGFWYLSGRSLTNQNLDLRAVGVKVTSK